MIKKLAIVLAGLGGGLVLFIVLMVAISPTEEAEETATEEIEESNMRITQDGSDVLAEFEVRPNATTRMTARGAQRDAQSALRQIRDDYSDYERAIVRATFPEGGYDGMVLNAGYDRETVERLELDDRKEARSVLSNLDSGSAHPDLLK